MQRHPGYGMGLAGIWLSLPVWGQPAAPAPADPQPPLVAGQEGSTEPVPSSPVEAPKEPPLAPERSLEKRIEQLQSQLEHLSAEVQKADLERLVEDAENEARAAEHEDKPEQREFLEGGLALQKLNPELTVSGDMVAALVVDGRRFYASETDRSGLLIRGLGVHLQHALDPYSMFKSALHFSPDGGVGLEEVYISWFGLIPATSFTLGRFRQNFGVVNRWHEHDLDQTSFPLALRLVLGDEGLAGDGLSAKWLMPPLWAHANELVVEVVDGSNEVLFSGEHFSVPSTLLHLKNYYDLSLSTYLELGVTAMFGFNNRRGFLSDAGELADEPWRTTFAGGADLTLYWSPPERAKYSSFTWRSELYAASKELPHDRARPRSESIGAYSYIQYQLGERWFTGIRGDLVRPTVRDSGRLAWDVVPYLTFWQSEFVYLRLEGQHAERLPYFTPRGDLERRTDNRVLLQVDFAAGPHKHEKY